MFHTDRGSEFDNALIDEALDTFGIKRSLSNKGSPYDNAVAENFFSCLKCELVHHRRFTTRLEAQDAIFAYIEAFYNTVRPHSALGWMPPALFERALLNHLVV